MVQGAPPALGAGLAEFDSRVPDCDAREQVNPARRERVLDGIVTRASPHLSSAGCAAAFPKRSESRSIRAREAECRVMRLVSQLDCRSSETSSILVRGANGSEAMVAERIPNPSDEVRFLAGPLTKLRLV